MERRTVRVSSHQWQIILEFLEENPSIARGYNNSSQGRATSVRLWQAVAVRLNEDQSGAVKTAKEWSTYVSNYKCKLKKTVTQIRVAATATGGGPPHRAVLSETDTRLLAILGPGFGEGLPQVQVGIYNEPTPEIAVEPQLAADPPVEIQLQNETEDPFINRIIQNDEEMEEAMEPELVFRTPQPANNMSAPTLPRRYRRSRRTRPLAPLDEARRVLSRIEEQRAASDAANARALSLLASNIGRLADAHEGINQTLNRLISLADSFFSSRTHPQ